MRLLQLLSLAADAELLRLKREAVVFGRCAVRSTLALVFGIAALVMLHFAAWHAFVATLGAAVLALILGTIDAALAGLLFWLAQPRRDLVAEEAARLRTSLLRTAQHTSPLEGAFQAELVRGPVAAMVGVAVNAAIDAWRRR
jgi:hypothetical protein